MAEGGQPAQLIAGRYRLVHALGTGGMGRVWQAHDEQLGTDVAIKELFLPSVMSPEERSYRLERARREARNAARLRDHPGIVTVHDVVMVGEVPWIVMQLVTGTTLQGLLRDEGRLPVDTVAKAAIALLKALGAAHKAGIVHRDIKPANVMVTDDHDFLLTDFGIAANEADAALTGTGVVMGSAPYLSPERARGGRGEASSDLFSLGTTLYEAVEGDSPFLRATAAGSQFAVVYDPAPPLRHAGRLTPVITGLLKKEPGGRLTIPEALELLASPAAEPKPEPKPEPESPPAQPPWTPHPPQYPPPPQPHTTLVSPARTPRAAATRAPASAGQRSRPDPGPAPRRAPRLPARRSRRTVVLSLLLILVIFTGGLAGGYRWTRSQFYVGVNQEHVALFRGINVDLAGVSLSDVEVDHPEIQLNYLPAYQRKQVEATIAEDGRDSATSRIQQFAEQASACKKAERRRRTKPGDPRPGLSAEEERLVPLCPQQ